MIKFLRTIAATIIIAAFMVVPASAAPTFNTHFFLWYDGNGNGLFDYFGSDYCVGGGQTLQVAKTGGGIQPIYYITMNHATVIVHSNADIMNCYTTSSSVFQLVPGATYLKTTRNPTNNQYFTTLTYGLTGTYITGHKVTVH